ncbi:unnamed protein product [Danaus chrysippus]|uniref:(African queen) hypothetical protein n=1 Tax=Danaus chrysippus TaxID=151541 RepID=A0A8J2QJ65_9NEOP|nr:unnamed protein product [Danaus chrysippus]
MGCTPSMLLDHKNRRDSTGSQEAALAKIAPTPVCQNKAVQAARAPRASLESDGFSIQLSSKKDSYVSQMGNNFATQLHIKRISEKLHGEGSSSGSPGARAGRRSSLALTPEDEPLVDIAVSTNDLLYSIQLINYTTQRKYNF